ncbi:hypothetical protein [Palleronia marisminoris]|uniref:hypothetical protein n=1 Tax=Palleronia marisminoris TaxID=315423 RepID=UPI00111402DD|nr:hypothetical protein [Palleronia marisminoris]
MREGEACFAVLVCLEAAAVVHAIGIVAGVQPEAPRARVEVILRKEISGKLSIGTSPHARRRPGFVDRADRPEFARELKKRSE